MSRSAGAIADLRASHAVILAFALLGATPDLPAQQSPPIPVRLVGPALAVVAGPIASGARLRVLSDGRVIVNDMGAHRLLLFDSTLRNASVLLDPTGATARRYPTKAGTLVPFVGDSSIFCDPSESLLIVLDPLGRVARTMPVLAPANRVAPCINYSAGRFDGLQRLVYRAAEMMTPGMPSMIGAFVPIHDSLPLLRATFGTSVVEVVGKLRALPAARSEPYPWQGRTIQRRLDDPFLTADDWTMTSDGTIAIVRTGDYHIDWLGPDGVRSSSPKLPYQWHRLSDSEKVAVVESRKVFLAAHPDQIHHPNVVRVYDSDADGLIQTISAR